MAFIFMQTVNLKWQVAFQMVELSLILSQLLPILILLLLTNYFLYLLK